MRKMIWKKKMLFDADFNFIKVVTKWTLDRKNITVGELVKGAK